MGWRSLRNGDYSDFEFRHRLLEDHVARGATRVLADSIEGEAIGK